MPPMRRGGNTGPKAVLADYAEKQAYQRREMEIKNLKNEVL